MEEWKEHFMRLLGGIEIRVVKGKRGEGRTGGEGDLERNKVGEGRRLKDGKASEIDGVQNEV